MSDKRLKNSNEPKTRMNFFPFNFIFDKIITGYRIESADDHVDYTPMLLNGESEIARMNSVTLLNGQRLNKQSRRKNDFLHKGLLLLTNFRLCFVPSEVSFKTHSQHQQNNFLEKFDITLANVDEIYAKIDNKFRIIQPYSKTMAKIDALKIICKNFRLITYNFTENNQNNNGRCFLDALAEVSYPKEHNQLFMYQFRDKYYNNFHSLRTFNAADDWIEELQRCGFKNDQKSFKIIQRDLITCSDNLPASFIIPLNISMIPMNISIASPARNSLVWTWGLKTASLIRMSEINENLSLPDHHHCVNLSSSLPSIHDIHLSYLKLRSICAPLSDVELMIQDEKFFTNLEKTLWLHNVSLCLKIANECSSKISNNQTVILQEIDGHDMNCVISSLIQLLLDPFYRTLRGFQEMIQKEWIAMGHPFGERLRNTGDGEISPIFLLFLDCTWQIHQQYPKMFEFTETFLTTLWDCLFLPIFDTFQFNSEKDRARAVMEDNLVLRPIWDWDEIYTDDVTELFKNPLYEKSPKCDEILMPSHYIWNLEIFTQCYLRFIPILEIKNGGFPQIDLFNRNLVEKIGKCEKIIEKFESNGCEGGQADCDDLNIIDLDSVDVDKFKTSVNSFHPFSHDENCINEVITNINDALTSSTASGDSLFDI